MGVLSGYRVIELAGLGPCPMAGMLLADMGAEVIVIDRGPITDPMFARDVSRRGKKSIIVDLKSDAGPETILKLVESADVLIEGFRPGVTEKLGVGPEDCLAANPALVYGRMTGWGQEGPFAKVSGHDINYISLVGALHAVRAAGEKPVPPVNLVGDFGGGTMFLVMGVLAALLEAKKSGKGQVVDAAMVDGAANLMWMCHSFHAAGYWDFDQPGTNWLDGGAYYYGTYECADGEYVAVGALEPQFFSKFVELAELDESIFNVEQQMDRSRWPAMKIELARAIKKKTRDQWVDIFEGTDACFTGVYSVLEATQHQHIKARGTFQEVDGDIQPSPAPRFSRTPSAVAHGMHHPGADTVEVLQTLGLDEQQIQTLLDQGTVKTH